jgi:hypothetical protein
MPLWIATPRNKSGLAMTNDMDQSGKVISFTIG